MPALPLPGPPGSREKLVGISLPDGSGSAELGAGSQTCYFFGSSEGSCHPAGFALAVQRQVLEDSAGHPHMPTGYPIQDQCHTQWPVQGDAVT